MRERLLFLALAFLTCSNASLDKRIRIEFLKVNITKEESTCSSNITEVLGPRLSIWTRKAIAKYLNYDPNSTALDLSASDDESDDARDRHLRRDVPTDEDAEDDMTDGDEKNLYGWKVSNDQMNGVDLDRYLAHRSTKTEPARSPVKSPVKAPVGSSSSSKSNGKSNSCTCSATGNAISCAIYYCANFSCRQCEKNRRRKLETMYDDAFLPDDDTPMVNVDVEQLTLFVQNQIRWRSRRWLVNHRNELNGCFGNFRKIRMFVYFDPPTANTPVVVIG